VPDPSGYVAQARDAVSAAYLQGRQDGAAESGSAQDSRLLNATMLRAIASAIEVVAAAANVQAAVDVLSTAMNRMRTVADRIDPTMPPPPADDGGG
jgi:hypothetical protein